MIRLLALLVLALLLAAPAHAQFTAPPTIVDARNVVVGSILGFGGANPDDPWEGTAHSIPVRPIDLPIVVLRSGPHVIKLTIDAFTIYGDTGVMFRSHDCTGTPYLLGEAATSSVIPVSAVYRDVVYQVSRPLAFQLITVGSYGDGPGCGRIDPLRGTAPVQAFGYRATRITDLRGRWTPPFRMR